jgi:hypothetical protein
MPKTPSFRNCHTAAWLSTRWTLARCLAWTAANFCRGHQLNILIHQHLTLTTPKPSTAPSKLDQNGSRQEVQIRQELRVYQLEAPACRQVGKGERWQSGSGRGVQ